MMGERGAGKRPISIICAFAVCVVSAAVFAQTRGEQDKEREQWQRVNDNFRAMGIAPGAVVADIGAGGGFFTTRLAAVVGSSGRVYAVDVDDTALDRLRRRLADEPHPNVTVIKGTPTDPRLPAGALDAALIVNAYHEMPEHQDVLTAIRAALKSTGRLVIVEPISESRRTALRADQTKHHEIAPEFVMQDARTAGLRIIGLEDPFTIRGEIAEWMMTVSPGVRANVASAGLPMKEPGSEPAQAPRSPDWGDPALRISVDEFLKLSSGGRATLIDVREEAMFTRSHIPGSVHIALEDIKTSADRLRKMKPPFVTYCS
jgi:predicted methyltransferase